VASIVAATGLAGCRNDPTDPPGPGGDPVIAWQKADQRGGWNRPYADASIAVFTVLREPVAVALDAKTGAPRWEARLPVPGGALGGGIPPEGSATGVDDLILVPAGDLFALDRSTGQIRWTFTKADDFPGSGKVLVHGGRVFTVGRRLYALDPSGGQPLWQRDLGDRAANPIGAGDTLFVTSSDLVPGTNVLGNGHLHSLLAATGTELWRAELAVPAPGRGGPFREPAVTDSLVLIATVDGRVVAFDRFTGAHRWTHSTGDERDGGVAVLGNVAITTGPNGYVLALDRRSGATVWSVPFFPQSGAVVNPVTVVESTAYVAQFWVKAYAENGTVFWTHGGADRGQPVYLTPPFVANGLVYIGGEKGLYALDPTKAKP